MADSKITNLPAATEVISTDLLVVVDDPGGSPVTKKITAGELSDSLVHYYDTPLTSTSWDGDAFSTTAKTIIDLSAVFSAPAGIRAVYVRVANRDSASAGTTGLAVVLWSTDAAGVGVVYKASGLTDNYYADNTFWVPCDANGDIYYQIIASGAGTMDIIMEVFGYQL